MKRFQLLQEEGEIRDRPSTEAGVVLRLRKGSQFFVDEAGGDGQLWLKVRSVTGKEGYLAADVKRKEVIQRAEDDEEGGAFAPERAGVRAGVVGGVIMMVIAAVWFFLGWQAGRVFFYPPILFVIGLYALVKGLLTGNVKGGS